MPNKGQDGQDNKIGSLCRFLERSPFFLKKSFEGTPQSNSMGCMNVPCSPSRVPPRAPPAPVLRHASTGPIVKSATFTASSILIFTPQNSTTGQSVSHLRPNYNVSYTVIKNLIPRQQKGCPVNSGSAACPNFNGTKHKSNEAGKQIAANSSPFACIVKPLFPNAVCTSLIINAMKRLVMQLPFSHNRKKGTKFPRWI